MKPYLYATLLFLVFSCLTGCGLVYTHTVEPLDLNMDQTIMDASFNEGGVKHFHWQVVDVMVDSNGIGDIARAKGMETVHYADMETYSILGVINIYTVHVYGW